MRKSAGAVDGFEGPGEEGTFTIRSLWLVSALTEIGEASRAQGLCEKLPTYASQLLLYTQEIEPHTVKHLPGQDTTSRALAAWLCPRTALRCRI